MTSQGSRLQRNQRCPAAQTDALGSEVDLSPACNSISTRLILWKHIIRGTPCECCPSLLETISHAPSQPCCVLHLNKGRPMQRIAAYGVLTALLPVLSEHRWVSIRSSYSEYIESDILINLARTGDANFCALLISSHPTSFCMNSANSNPT